MSIRESITGSCIFLMTVFGLAAQSPASKMFSPERYWIEQERLKDLPVDDMLEDSRGFLWLTTYDALIRFDGASFTIFEKDPDDTTGLAFLNLCRLLEDRQGRIWIGTTEAGISVFDPVSEAFTNYRSPIPTDKGSFSFNEVNSLMLDLEGRVWIATDRGIVFYHPGEKSFFDISYGTFVRAVAVENDHSILIAGDMNPPGSLVRYSPLTRSVEKLVLLDQNGGEIRENIGKLIVIQNGDVWIATQDHHLFRGKKQDPADGKTYSFSRIPWLDDQWFNDLMETRSGDIWVATRKGFFILNGHTGEQIEPVFRNNVSYQKWNTGHHCLLEDAASNIWVGTFKGVLKFRPDDDPVFEGYRLPPNLSFPASLITIASTCFEEVDEDRMLIGASGLYIFDKPSRQLSLVSKIFPELAQFENAKIQTIFRDEQSGLWISTYDEQLSSSHLYRLDLASGRVSEILPRLPLVFEIVEAPDGTFWLATFKGLVHYDLKRGLIQRYLHEPDSPNSLSDNDIYSLALENDTLLWVGTGGGGLNCLNLKTMQFTCFQFNAADKTSLSGNIVPDIYIDTGGTIWVATNGGGLSSMGADRNGFTRYLKKNGLNSLHVFSVGEDGKGGIWIGTNKGISRLDIDTGKFRNYRKEADIPLEGNSYNGQIRDGNGYIYFGGPHQFIRFHPDNFFEDTSPTKVILTSFFLNNQKVGPSDTGSPLERSISLTRSLTLKHDQNFLGFQFSVPGLREPDQKQYAYRMSGIYDEWQYIGNKHEVSFTNLDPGKYTFQVIGSNPRGIWSKEGATLLITIRPPWYKTHLAYGIYMLTVIALLFGIRQYELRRQMTRAETRQLKALDQAKTQLYTNITHEFRTPLTVILGMAEQVKGDPKNWFNEGLGLIRRNGKQLLNLVNQMLDLSKLESGHMRLNLVQGDIIGYLRYLCESFHSYADSKDIRLHFASDFKELSMDFDPEKMQHILSNLLSNAIKFTPAGGDVYVEVREHPPSLKLRRGDEDREQLWLQVRDNGRGIAPEHLPHIFDRFYQVDPSATRRGEGTGIGLALTKELVKLMGGRIEVESELDKGAQFSIRLPVTRMAEPATATPEEVAIGDVIQLERPFTSAEPEVPPGDQPLVLLIEDNADVITYLRSFLGGEYQIITATSGQEGIDKALEHIPDLVVSDVMMPEKDGFEVCATLKTDERSSHIPVILLTAKSDDASRLEGLTHGADAYLAKPFNKEELLVRIEKLIELRRRLQAHYQRAGELVQLKEKTDPTPEDRFLQKLVAIVEENLADENFGLPDLCRKAGLSRSQLFRKVKALTGKPTTHFIRSIRLARAKELLETTGMSVSEVAFAVGFSWLNYFSRVFREEFGVMPSEVRGK